MKLLITLLLCVLAFNSYASKKALTDEGDVVILHDDGTWNYEQGSPANVIELTLNPQTFSKHDNSTFNLKSTRTNSAFAFDPKKWRFKKSDNGHDVAEYTFELKSGDLYAMAISEQVEIAVEDLANIAFDNAKAAAPDTKVLKKEYRVVNGEKVIYMEMVGTIQSIKFQYLGYYYSNASGSTQYLVYTGENLVAKYQDDINHFLNGFIVNK